MATCIVCEEREGTAGFGGCCTTVCQQMTQANIQTLMSSQDKVLKERQVTARTSVLAASLTSLGNVPSELATQLQAIALEDDGRTS